MPPFSIDQREVSVSPSSVKHTAKKSPTSESRSEGKFDEVQRKRQLKGYRDLVIKPAPLLPLPGLLLDRL